MELLNLIFESLIHLLLQNKAFDFDLSILLLRSEVSLQLLFIFLQNLVFPVNPLGDVCDQVEVMSKFNFLLFSLRRLVPLLRLLLLDSLLRFVNLRLVNSLQLFELLVLKRLQMLVIIVNVFENLILILLSECPIHLHCVGLEALSDPELALQGFDLLPVLQLVLLVAFCATDDLTLLLLVRVLLALNF